jgi:hypothetical protein
MLMYCPVASADAPTILASAREVGTDDGRHDFFSSGPWCHPPTRGACSVTTALQDPLQAPQPTTQCTQEGLEL